MKKFDDSFRTEKIKLIAGTDEAGRGPLAGPVVCASVIFHPDFFLEDVDDSKKLSAKKRVKLFDEIINSALSYSYKIVSNETIDEINILQASLRGMKESIDALNINPDLILVDGNKKFDHNIEAIAIVKGDSKSFSIAAASIIAKVIRDRIMIDLSKKFPNYLWEVNKGYPTKKHIEAIRKYGVTEYHRKTFLRKILNEQYEIF
ncbi:MAG: ribonuclease HII [Chlorobiaceae bacterium]|nr:ribonuclease HII [Chlorobiaceae bacterium]MBA4310107.1 ribonuclease HII [Chlorobiaceae bacterium]